MDKKLMLLVAVSLFILGLVFLRQGGAPVDERNYCTQQSRQVDACAQIYEPVCGWRQDGSHETFSNSCMACMNEDIVYWTEGGCADGGK